MFAVERRVARYAPVSQRIVAEDFSRLVGKNDYQRVSLLMILEGVVLQEVVDRPFAAIEPAHIMGRFDG